uniref:PPM-type phosphatase domain-containing protein n=1 Tax=Solanum lycopersicum TaxID=4081 RepID=A0A3Q7H1A6_SOLLC
MKRLIIYGFFFACIVGFLMNNKPEPEIPQFGLNDGVEQVKIGVVAVFDGHIGSEASETASRFFLK